MEIESFTPPEGSQHVYQKEERREETVQIGESNNKTFFVCRSRLNSIKVDGQTVVVDLRHGGLVLYQEDYHPCGNVSTSKVESVETEVVESVV